MKSKDIYYHAGRPAYKIFLRDWRDWFAVDYKPSNVYDTYMNNLLLKITEEHLEGIAQIDSLSIVFSYESDYLYWYLKVGKS